MILQDKKSMQNLMQDHKSCINKKNLFSNNPAKMQKTIKIWPDLEILS